MGGSCEVDVLCCVASILAASPASCCNWRRRLHVAASPSTVRRTPDRPRSPPLAQQPAAVCCPDAATVLASTRAGSSATASPLPGRMSIRAQQRTPQLILLLIHNHTATMQQIIIGLLICAAGLPQPPLAHWGSEYVLGHTQLVGSPDQPFELLAAAAPSRATPGAQDFERLFGSSGIVNLGFCPIYGLVVHHKWLVRAMRTVLCAMRRAVRPHAAPHAAPMLCPHRASTQAPSPASTTPPSSSTMPCWPRRARCAVRCCDVRCCRRFCRLAVCRSAMFAIHRPCPC